jgi:hypothetical protein
LAGDQHAVEHDRNVVYLGKRRDLREPLRQIVPSASPHPDGAVHCDDHAPPVELRLENPTADEMPRRWARRRLSYLGSVGELSTARRVTSQQPDFSVIGR